MRMLTALVALAPFVSSANAQAPDPSPDDVSPEDVTTERAVPQEQLGETSEPFFDVFHNERLTGDWWGGRTWLEDRGIEFAVSLTSIYQHNVRGGLQTRNGHRITGSADYELIFDLERMGVWKGGIFYVAAENSWNDGIGEDRVGSLIAVNDDAAGDVDIIIREVWYEQTFWESKARFRLGKVSMTTDADANAYANDQTSQFMNTALVNAVSFPAPDGGLGFVLVVQPVDWFYVNLQAADAQAVESQTGFKTTFHDEDHFFGSFEFGFLPIWQTARGNLPGAYRLGMWYDPQPKEVFASDLLGRRRTFPVKRDDVGFYFNMDQVVWKEDPQDAADSQGLGVFMRYAYAHEDVNPIEHHWSLGAQYQGLIPARDDDVLGFGFAQVIPSDKLREIEGISSESIYELYYNASVFPWLTVSPDVQFISDPGGGTAQDSFVAGVRLQMAF